ncbi:MAG: glycosyltransferase family 1 protein, partial [Bacteroidales bacterium]|nr:glycosyltransferase family 1 protein [Bacteroidales bacterium]
MYKIGFDAKRAFTNFTGLGNYSRFTISSLSHLFNYNEYFLYTPKYRDHPLQEFARAANITIRKPEGLLKVSSSLWRSYGMAGQMNRDHIELFHGLNGELPFC